MGSTQGKMPYLSKLDKRKLKILTLIPQACWILLMIFHFGIAKRLPQIAPENSVD